MAIIELVTVGEADACAFEQWRHGTAGDIGADRGEENPFGRGDENERAIARDHHRAEEQHHRAAVVARIGDHAGDGGDHHAQQHRARQQHADGNRIEAFPREPRAEERRVGAAEQARCALRERQTESDAAQASDHPGSVSVRRAAMALSTSQTGLVSAPASSRWVCRRMRILRKCSLEALRAETRSDSSRADAAVSRSRRNPASAIWGASSLNSARMSAFSEARMSAARSYSWADMNISAATTCAMPCPYCVGICGGYSYASLIAENISIWSASGFMRPPDGRREPCCGRRGNTSRRTHSPDPCCGRRHIRARRKSRSPRPSGLRRFPTRRVRRYRAGYRFPFARWKALPRAGWCPPAARDRRGSITDRWPNPNPPADFPAATFPNRGSRACCRPRRRGNCRFDNRHARRKSSARAAADCGATSATPRAQWAAARVRLRRCLSPSGPPHAANILWDRV